MDDGWQLLIAKAQSKRSNAYAPYSSFCVGAAVEDEQGRIHAGCNVENVAYPLGACAEANAIGAMIANGGAHIRRIAIIGGPRGAEAVSCPPCGGCRQRIAEFSDQESRILFLGADGQWCVYTMAELLPGAFDRDSLPEQA